MGIKKLNKWIQWVSPSLGETPVCWESFKGKRIGIDALGFLYKANEDHISDCLFIAEYIAFWRSHNIEPIFVFDGCVPTEKRGTCNRRRQYKETLPEDKQVYVTPEDRNRVKRLLYACGVMFVNALEEADTVLAFLMKRGDISAVVSKDLDFLARGCDNLLVPTGTHPGEWTHLSIRTILKESGLSYNQFVCLCVLLGSDYCPSLPSLSFSLLTCRVQQDSLESILKREGIRNPSLWLRAVDILKGERNTWETIVSEKQRMKWDIKITPEVDTLKEFLERDLCSLSIRKGQLLQGMYTC